MKFSLVRFILVSITTSVCGCVSTAMVHETVLRPGERIAATNRFGTVRITYVSANKRLYEGQDFHEVKELRARDERWYGCLGLYDPADTFLSASKIRLVLQEGIRNFASQDQMLSKLNEASATMDWVYDNTGLVVGFGRVPTRGNQINIDVFQYLLKGKKPLHVPHARPSQIHRESLNPISTEKYNTSHQAKPQDEIPPLIDDPFNPNSAGNHTAL